ncbi:uncharacterized protein LOC132641741 isoform X2 [Lycium barbarum]|uniref:uncharacterized protein LOC132641741 isoform X2 n=1 Tax=Lycium barbarum TaxID=112863 RepID=UPI00293E9525|nr:uncharacterized protein LOC132641741 isoform X2 [Lycium barbarum]
MLKHELLVNHSRRIPCPRPGRIWLEQRGIQRSLYWHIEARVVLDLQEFIKSDNVRELHFSMVDGDFKKFEGKWSVRVGTRIVPNLAISKILSRDNNKVRTLQEGCKGLLYMVLHAHVVLDLSEHIEQEISFEQVEGDFDFFQGKWMLEQLGSHHTLLKYTLESKMHKNSFLSEAIMEEVIYEDLPSNLCAIRDYIEKRETEKPLEKFNHDLCREASVSSSIKDSSVYYDRPAGQNSESSSLYSPRQRPKVRGLQRDIEVLKVELLAFISEHGQEGFMPMRKQLRKHERVDTEKAITRMGGFRRIASLMDLSLAYKHRKPKGYWDNLENLQEEISRFQKNWGMDPSYMPSRKSFERAGRYDIARALEKWGGLHEVSRLLTLKASKQTSKPCQREES